ncbi:MAG TPA: YvcK family protein [Chloroflexi bacterium]|nr:YvcK family protein [Chloroflexota bacterium]
MRVPTRFRPYLRWLLPGMGVKRWLLVMALGVALLGLGLGILLAQVPLFSVVPRYLGLDFLPVGARALVYGLLGLAVLILGLARLNRTLLSPFVPDTRAAAEALYRHRKRSRGPRVVAIGGGHGLSTLLRGLKTRTSNITAIVTVADDGGSSGRLRRALGVLPPGDIRNCLAALADDEALLAQLFQYRFPATSVEAGLNGHSFGNLFITAMAEVTGSFERAVLESSRVLAIQGRVLPSTLHSVTLMGDLRNEPVGVSRVEGESRIASAGGVIERVYLEPDDVPAYPEAVRAILEADLIVLGPGSLYTSLLPNLLVREIARAVAASRAVRVYVCNVATQPGETDGYTVEDHVAALERHVEPGLFPLVLANANFAHADALPEGVEPVRLGTLPPPGPEGGGPVGTLHLNATYTLYAADLVDPTHPWRHDGRKLVRALMTLLERERV